MKNLLDTKTMSLQDILGNGKVYKIPSFQRDYSWTEENWEDLWNDLLITEESQNPHYMGTIVLQTTEKDDLFIVVDGQQRLTTMTIFSVATIQVLQDLHDKGIEPDKNKERIEEIQRSFIGKKTISGLHYESKLKLNRNNDLFFQDTVLNRKEPLAVSKLKDSERLLFEVYQYFYKKLSEKFAEDSGFAISLFLESIVAKKMIFIQIMVDSDLNAYTVFETLNARGVELTTTDLLKNYLFSICEKSKSDSDMAILEDRWCKIVHNIGLKEFPIFLRYYLNSKQPLVRKEQLFKSIKTQVSSSAEVFDLLDVLEKKSYLYNAISHPEDDFWNPHPQQKEIRKALEELKLFNVSQPTPLMFSLYDNMPECFHSLLKAIVAISFRYNLIAKKNPNELETVYNAVAQKVFHRSLSSEREVVYELNRIYVPDQDFKSLFSTKEMNSGRNKKVLKYILIKIENHISQTDYDWQEADSTIEHILPENYSPEWNALFDQQAEKFVYRLGNYTLLEDKLNRACSNKSYAEKKEKYIGSRYKLSNEICIKDEWNARTLSHYQSKLADYASGIWKLNFQDQPA